MNTLTICLLTYNRFDYAQSTLRAILDNISYDGTLRVHIADDGSSVDRQRECLAEIAGGYAKVKGITVTNSERGGYGKSYNLAMQQVHVESDFIIPIEDDWVLLRPFDITPFTQVLSESKKIGCIRMGYIGFTQALRGEFVYECGQHFLLLDPNSPEPHVFAGHPRIETKVWERKVGPWTEGLGAGSTEFEVAHRPDARVGVAWPIDAIKPYGDLFAHIGAVKA